MVLEFIEIYLLAIYVAISVDCKWSHLEVPIRKKVLGLAVAELILGGVVCYIFHLSFVKAVLLPIGLTILLYGALILPLQIFWLNNWYHTNWFYYDNDSDDVTILHPRHWQLALAKPKFLGKTLHASLAFFLAASAYTLSTQGFRGLLDSFNIVAGLEAGSLFLVNRIVWIGSLGVVAIGFILLAIAMLWFQSGRYKLRVYTPDEEKVARLLGSMQELGAYNPNAHSDLVKMGSRAVLPLISHLTRHNPWAADVVDALGDIGDPRAVKPLKKALHSRDRLLREAARKALGKIRDPRTK